MSANLIPLKWKRPESAEYPKVWHRFMARDLDSDDLVEYRIEDLTIEKAKDAYEHMKENYIRDEPISEVMHGYDDEDLIDEYLYAWRSILNQKMTLVCFRNGSNEIAGLNWTFIECEEDHFSEKLSAYCKSPGLRCYFDIDFHICRDFDLFNHYGVDKYMACFGLSVGRRYRGRGIGEQLMGTQEIICREYGVKLSQMSFSSNFSSRIAEKLGFKIDREISYEEAGKIFPQYDLSSMKSKTLSFKTIVY